MPGGGKNSFLQVLKVFLLIIKYDKLKFTILTRLAKQKVGQKLHFQALYGLLKLENEKMLGSPWDENGVCKEITWLKQYLQKIKEIILR